MPVRWWCRRATTVVAAGITINGLPLMLKRPNLGTMDIDNLDDYYEDCVIGGPGAFVVPIREREQFVEATRTKLVLEIAGREPAAARHAGLGRQAARVLHHRRREVAAALGRFQFPVISARTCRRSPREMNSGTDRPA